MYINASLGILYDALFYNVVYFNRRAVESRFRSLTHETADTIFYNYDTFRSRRTSPTPPDCLYPFFHYSETFSCVLTKYLMEKVDFFDDSIQDFFKRLEDKRSFKEYVFTHYLHTYDGINMKKVLLADGENVAKALTLLSQSIKIDHFYTMFYHFNQLLGQLVTYLKDLLVEVEKFHAQHEDKEKIVQAFISSDNYASQVKRACMLSGNVNFEKQTYSVCFLSPYLIMRRSTRGRKPFAFLLGDSYLTVLNQFIDYRYITMHSMVKTYGNGTKLNIIRELSKKEMTISQLSRELHLSRSSIGRYVDDLVEEVAITRVRKVGADIYLRLNPDYFIHSKSVFQKYVDDVLRELNANV